MILILIMTYGNFLNSITDFTWLTIIYVGNSWKKGESNFCVTKDSYRVHEIRKIFGLSLRIFIWLNYVCDLFGKCSHHFLFFTGKFCLSVQFLFQLVIEMHLRNELIIAKT